MARTGYDMPLPHCVLAPTCATLLCSLPAACVAGPSSPYTPCCGAPHCCTHYIIAAHATSWCLLQLHTSHYRAPCGHMHHIAVPLTDACTALLCLLVQFFFFLLLTSLFLA